MPFYDLSNLATLLEIGISYAILFAQTLLSLADAHFPSVLFLFFQVLIALILAVAGTPSAWDAFHASARWWTFMAFLANFVSIYLLMRVFKAEGKRYSVSE